MRENENKTSEMQNVCSLLKGGIKRNSQPDGILSTQAFKKYWCST